MRRVNAASAIGEQHNVIGIDTESPKNRQTNSIRVRAKEEGVVRKGVHVAFACFLLLSVAHVGLAQNTNSSDIRGTVTDLSGAVLPGATVTVKNNDTGVVREFVSNGDGLYDTNSILPGNYTVSFTKDGFQKLVRGPFALQVGLVAVNAEMKVGSSTQVVEVTSESPLLKTEDAQVATTLSTEQLTDLPSVDPVNGWTSLLKLLPGATSTPGGTNGHRRNHAILLQLSG